MFPERDLANEFWQFVYDRALDMRGRSRLFRPEASVLDEIEIRREEVQWRLTPDELRDDLPALLLDADLHGLTVGRSYETLQEALLAFLIDASSKGRFPRHYAIWLRMVALVFADAVRDPSRLHIVAHDYSEGIPDGDRQWEQTMVASDDWSCISHEAFNFIIKSYRSNPL